MASPRQKPNTLLIDTMKLFDCYKFGLPQATGYKEGTIDLDKFDANAVNDKDETLLFVAASQGHFEVVRWLVEQGAMIDYSPHPEGKTPLFVAAEKALILITDEKIAADNADAAFSLKVTADIEKKVAVRNLHKNAILEELGFNKTAKKAVKVAGDKASSAMDTAKNANDGWIKLFYDKNAFCKIMKYLLGKGANINHENDDIHTFLTTFLPKQAHPFKLYSHTKSDQIRRQLNRICSALQLPEWQYNATDNKAFLCPQKPSSDLEDSDDPDSLDDPINSQHLNLIRDYFKNNNVNCRYYKHPAGKVLLYVLQPDLEKLTKLPPIDPEVQMKHSIRKKW